MSLVTISVENLYSKYLMSKPQFVGVNIELTFSALNNLDEVLIKAGFTKSIVNTYTYSLTLFKKVNPNYIKQALQNAFMDLGYEINDYL
jgi:hypothetical protein